MSFAPAVRQATRARVMLCGPSGSGKSVSALRLARGLAPGGIIGVVDTEADSALSYAGEVFDGDVCEFGHESLTAPYHPDRLIDLVSQATAARVDVLIVDSLTHFWSGIGGVLDLKEQVVEASKSKDSFAAWAKVVPLQNRMIDALLRFPGHLICTVRAKEQYEVIHGDKTKIVRLGMGPIQKDDVFYEFPHVAMLEEGHDGTWIKSRWSAWDGKRFGLLTSQHGADLADWHRTGDTFRMNVNDFYERLRAATPEHQAIAKQCATDVGSTLSRADLLADQVRFEMIVAAFKAKTEPSDIPTDVDPF